MMKSCLISILVSLVSFTAAWGQASGTQVTETDSTLTLRNSKVRVEFPKGEAFDISKLTLNGKELVLSKGYNTVPWTLTYKGPQTRYFSPLTASMPDGQRQRRTDMSPLPSNGTCGLLTKIWFR